MSSKKSKTTFPHTLIGPAPPWTNINVKLPDLNLLTLGYLTASSDMNRIWYWHTVFATLFISALQTFLLQFDLENQCWKRVGGTQSEVLAQERWQEKDFICWGTKPLVGPFCTFSHKCQRGCAKVSKWKCESESVTLYLLKSQTIWSNTCWTLLNFLTTYCTAHTVKMSKWTCESESMKVKVLHFICWGDKPLVLPFCTYST